MIQFFRLNDPFRIIGVFVILLILRLPFLLGDFPFTVAELDWLLLGEAMDNDKPLYSAFWDTTGPLSAGVYWLLHELFGRSRVPFFALSILLVTVQAFFFNLYLIRANVYNEKTYLPALLYALFMSFSFDFFTLSPVLMALTFLVFMLPNLFKLDEGAADREVFRVGLFLGIAVLFYLPSVFFLLMALMSFALFRTSSGRYLLLVLYGFFFVVGLAFIYFFLLDRMGAFYRQYFLSFFGGGMNFYVSRIDLLKCSTLPLIALFYSAFKTFSERGFINYQVNCQQIMLIWLLSALLTLLLNHSIATFQLGIAVPVLSFFGTHLLLLMRKRWLAEAYFWVFFGLMISFMALQAYRTIPKISIVDYSKLVLPPPDKASDAPPQKILVLGNDHTPYQGNTTATPYFNWELAQRHFNQMEDYQVLTEIFQNFQQDPPELVIDRTPDNKMRALLDRLPLLGERYRSVGEGRYVRKVAP